MNQVKMKETRMSENKDSTENLGTLNSYPLLDYIGVYFGLGREIVREKVTHASSILCEWTDGERGCCEVWRHESEHGISVRESLELASKDGWVVVCDRPVCGHHMDDPDDNDVSDLADMRKHFGG